MDVDEFQEEPRRRQTRSALAEIPTRLGMLAIEATFDGRRSFNNNTQNTIHSTPTTHNLLLGVPPSVLTPSPSPDEMVIQQRGRRRIPVVWSPDIDELKKVQQEKEDHRRTPVKQNCQNNTSIVLRSTPRKRLLLLDPVDASPSDRAKRATKRPKVDHVVNLAVGGLPNALKALTADQLILVIEQLVAKSPDLETSVQEVMPEPDLLPLEDNLIVLKRNIMKSLPTSRLFSKTDTAAFKIAALHVLAFKNAIVDQGQRLVDSQQWAAVLDYVLMAWNIVRDTPQWDFASHNILRRQCFKALTTFCQAALKNGHFEEHELQDFYESTKEFVDDSSGFDVCFKLMNVGV